MDLTGKVIAILPSQVFKGREGDIVKNAFVVETFGQYPKKCVFSVIGSDKWNQFGLSVGCSVKVYFDIKAREWEGRWFNDVSAYRVEMVSGGGQQAPNQTSADAKPEQPNYAANQQPMPHQSESAQGDGEDLPF